MWCLSATFTAAAGFGGALAYGRSFHKVARRVSQSGGALAGWPGAAGSRRGNRVLITDLDLFPPGFVELNGIKVFGDFSVERVVGYTATPDPGLGLWAGKALPRPAPHPGGHLPQGGQPVLL